MKKLLLIVFILLDVAVLGASAVFLVSHIKGTPLPMGIPGMATSMTSPSTAMPMSSPAMNVATSSITASAQTPTPAAIGAPASAVPAGSRKIGFAYRNSRAKKVMIRAEFTGWRAEPMEKDPVSGAWKYMKVLEPGEYAYCYSVDDKSIRDPANKHTKLVGKTLVSLIVVQPLPAAPH